MGGGFLDRLIHDDQGRVRAAWRIVLFFFLFILLGGVGQYVVSVVPPHPLQWVSLVAWTIAALLAGWILLSTLDRRRPGALGFPLHRRAIGETFAGLGFGAALIGAAVLALLLSGSARFVADTGSVPGYIGFLSWTLLFFGIAAALEEVIFRGYPFQALVEWVGAWPAVLIASLVFAFLHGQNPNVTPLALANIFLAGVLLSIAYLRTRSLWFATGVHVGWNWTMASLFDFPVSGLIFDTPLYTGEPVGSDLWTGGDFGPEAGVVGTLVILIGLWISVRAGWLAPSEHIRAMRPLVDKRLPSGGLR